MMKRAEFIGYKDFGNMHWKAQFKVWGTHFPDGSIVDADTILTAKVPRPDYPSYHHWQRSRFAAKLRAAKSMREALKLPDRAEIYYAKQRVEKMAKDLSKKMEDHDVK